MDDSLEIRHLRHLQDALDGKQGLLSDVPGTGISLLHGARLRKVFGHGGIAATHSLNVLDFNDLTNFQVKVSGADLQSSIATLSSTVADVTDGLASLEQALDALSQAAPSGGTTDNSGLLPNTGPATFTGNLTVTGAFYAGSLETGHALLIPRIVSPSGTDLAIRNHGNAGGLSISNATENVSVANSLALGAGGFIREHDTGGFRVLQTVNDARVNFAVSSQAVPSSLRFVSEPGCNIWCDNPGRTIQEWQLHDWGSAASGWG